MTRLLLAGTACVALLTSGAFAQSSSSSMPRDATTISSQMSDASSMESSMIGARAPIDITTGYTAVDTDRLATKIIGSPVYDGTAKDSNNLGNITDLVLGNNGDVAAVVIGVGGFLGIGQKQVAVDYTALQWTTAADNSERFVLQTTKDELTAAPDFKTVDDQPSSSAASTDPSASSSTAVVGAASTYPASADQIQPGSVTDPQDFATKAGTAGLFEIQSSQLAVSKAQNNDIKAFAQMMIDDHTKAANELKAAAAAQGNVNVPAALDQPKADQLAQLSGASAADFDKLYVQLQTDAHVEAVALFTGYAANGPAGQLKDFAASTAPTLKMHYDHVLALPR